MLLTERGWHCISDFHLAIIAGSGSRSIVLGNARGGEDGHKSRKTAKKHGGSVSGRKGDGTPETAVRKNSPRRRKEFSGGDTVGKKGRTGSNKSSAPPVTEQQLDEGRGTRRKHPETGGVLGNDARGSWGISAQESGVSLASISDGGGGGVVLAGEGLEGGSGENGEKNSGGDGGGPLKKGIGYSRATLSTGVGYYGKDGIGDYAGDNDDNFEADNDENEERGGVYAAAEVATTTTATTTSKEEGRVQNMEAIPLPEKGIVHNDGNTDHEHHSSTSFADDEKDRDGIYFAYGDHPNNLIGSGIMENYNGISDNNSDVMSKPNTIICDTTTTSNDNSNEVLSLTGISMRTTNGRGEGGETAERRESAGAEDDQATISSKDEYEEVIIHITSLQFLAFQW